MILFTCFQLSRKHKLLVTYYKANPQTAQRILSREKGSQSLLDISLTIKDLSLSSIIICTEVPAVIGVSIIIGGNTIIIVIVVCIHICRYCTIFVSLHVCQYCRAQSQLQPQLDLASLIISSLPATHPASHPESVQI